MMIDALLILHIWFLIIGGVVWVLQRDRGNETGGNFPWPAIWLGFIYLGLFPAAFAGLPHSPAFPSLDISTMTAVMIPKDLGPISKGLRPNWIMIYGGVAGALMLRTLWSWARLQRTKLTPSQDPKVMTTQDDLPPHSLSWPRRVIVLPETLVAGRANVIAHERAHLKFWDAELTLLLLLLRDVFLFNPGLDFLIRGWRQAIEIRADKGATAFLSADARAEYAQLLLDAHRPSPRLPCPTAYPPFHPYRSLKMRLNAILKETSSPSKPRWHVATAAAALATVALSLSLGQTAMAEDDTPFTLETDEITMIYRTPPKMPKSCPGLKFEDINIDTQMMRVDGKPQKIERAIVGTVVLKYDVRPDGTTHNLRVEKSNQTCFEPHALAAVEEWKGQQSHNGARDIAVILQFALTAEPGKTLEQSVAEFTQG